MTAGVSRTPGPRRAALSILALLPLVAGADGPTLEQVGADYSSIAKPLLARYCLDCHATDVMEGDLDLERFATLGDVRKDTAAWLKVAEMLDNGEMPPKDARRMPDADRRALRDWLARYLKAEALAGAGDPGPVVIRRLSNAQYTYTLRDLTGVPLDPAREFPVDGAAGEGFTNTGGALVMSPALLSKYLDAAKDVAAHAVPLPDGLRFSPGTTRRDWTDEALEAIRSFYAEFTDSGGGTEVNLQGIVFGTNTGGLLPLKTYLAATLDERDALASGSRSIEDIARERRLSPKYLSLLWRALTSAKPSPLLDALRSRWKAAGPGDAPALAAEVGRWQSALWKFNAVGHIGKVGGPTSWMEPVSPLRPFQEFRLPIPASPDGKAVTLTLVADDAGGGESGGVVTWERPRLVAAGMPDLPIRDVPAVARALASRRARIFAGAAGSLKAAAEAEAAGRPLDRAELAQRHDVPADVLDAWFDGLGIGDGGGPVTITTHLRGRLEKTAGYDFVNGWGSGATPNVLANASETHVRVPGNMKPRGVAMHPSPTLRIVAGWQGPASASVRVAAKVQHAHPECGNGVTWALEVRRGQSRLRLAAGLSQGSKAIDVGPFPDVHVRRGDMITLAIGPRDGNHACDLTAVDLSVEGDGNSWDLAADVSPDILAGNPHADRLGNPDVWHFFTEPDASGDPGDAIPPDSLLARWQSAATREQKTRLADELQALLTAGPPVEKDSPDGLLYRRLASLRGPLLRDAREALVSAVGDSPAGLGPARFGRLPGGEEIDPTSLGARAPSTIEVVLPADLVEGCEFVATARPGPASALQFRVVPGPATEVAAPDPARPVVASEGSPARARFERGFEAFRGLFPPALCYTKIVPVDEVVTLTLFYREDDHLRRLLLDDAQAARLDRLWEELRFLSQDALTLVDAFQQLLEYASQDGDPSQFEPLRGPIEARAEAFRRTLREAEPRQVEAVVNFAAKAYRRPLSDAEAGSLRALYGRLRGEGLSHDDAWRLLIARVLVAPAFLYRVEAAAPGTAPAPVDDWALASRLSYFLWSSAPDEALRSLAAAGRLRDPDVLAAEARRMLRDEKVRRLAGEFACQWLHVYDFDAHDEKSERHFPTFAGLRSAMHEEVIRFFTEIYRRDLPALAFLDADFAVVNGPLAEHYGIPGVAGDDWRRIDGVKVYGRGGILGLAAPLSQQSGASRTSPILRGTWISEVLLGEKLPKPPAGVPPLPDDEAGADDGLTVRQLVERHSRDPKCAGCHARVDPLGFALEGYDAIGRRRDADLGGRPVDVATTLPDGTALEGFEGLRGYMLSKRREAVARQFGRKLLGYALGRGVRLTDEPLLDELTGIVARGGRFGETVEAIVRSRQFREIRGRDAAGGTEAAAGDS